MDALWLRLASMSNKSIMVVALIATLLYYFAFFNDGSALRKNIENTDALVRTEEEKAAVSDAALREVEQVRAAVGTLVDQFKTVSTQLPTEVAMSDVIRAVDMVSKTTGVSIKVKEPQPMVRRDILEELPLKIQMEGTYGEITSFLFYISSLERIMKVRTLDMALQMPLINNFGGPPPKSTGKLNFEGEIVSYRFVGEEKTEPAVTDAAAVPPVEGGP